MAMIVLYNNLMIYLTSFFVILFHLVSLQRGFSLILSTPFFLAAESSLIDLSLDSRPSAIPRWSICGERGIALSDSIQVPPNASIPKAHFLTKFHSSLEEVEGPSLNQPNSMDG